MWVLCYGLGTMEIKADMVSLAAFPGSTFKAVFTSIWDYANPTIG